MKVLSRLSTAEDAEDAELRCLLVAIHDAANALTQVRDVEIEQQPDVVTTEFQIGHDLRKMKRQQFFHRLKFYDDAVFDQEVDAIPSVESDLLIRDWQPDLMTEFQSVGAKLIPRQA
jgi:hypothetical protein